MKRFKTRKTYLKNYLYLFFLLLILYFGMALFLKIKVSNSNETLIHTLLMDIPVDKKYRTNFFLTDPKWMLEKTFSYAIKEEYELCASDGVESVSSYIEDTKKEEVKNPIIYIYNTHQTENYSYKRYEDYNVIPNVLLASYILREKLEKEGLETLVETSNMQEILNMNAWNYASSYKASRYLLKDTLKKYPSIKLVIDLHRDSISKKQSTVEVNKKKYAKVLFVIGRENKNYKKNLEEAKKLNSYINKNITRGILEKEGKGVNGVYNQDVKPFVLLIECGGVENSLEEVINTLDVLTDAIKKYIGEL